MLEFASAREDPRTRVIFRTCWAASADTVGGLGKGVDGAAVERRALDHNEAT
jgi:hypothetical protein